MSNQAIYKNGTGGKVFVRAFNEITGDDKTGDAGNITAQISLDGAAAVSTNGLAEEVDAADHPGLYAFALSDAEHKADIIHITPVSSTANIKLAPVEVVSKIGANSVVQGVIAGSTANSTDMTGYVAATDDIYNGMLISIVSGTGVGQSRHIEDYNGTLKIATIEPDWATNPDTTSVFEISPGNVDIYNATIAQPGQEAPVAKTTIMNMIRYLFKGFRNQWTNDGTTVKLFNDDGATVDQKQTVSETAGTAKREEMISGP